ncbi:MAG: hypothetical protein PHH98_03180 [Candidatus Gracilibacteria bacterium]|nr:hypothetical protein [Candidatus Gracilibacteria bacterium]
MSENINQKVINNAISAYLMVFISWLFLFNKDNENINNSFVKNHTKSAMAIHMMIIINYIIFISYSIFGSLSVFGYSLNIIIANIIFILIGIVFVNGIYHASKGNEFKIGGFIKTTKGISLDLNNDKNFDEHDKLNILLSHIPFLGFMVGAKFKNEKIENILKLNLFISLILSLIYIFGHNNIVNFLSLIYIIYIVFAGVNLYVREELVTINLPYYFLPKGKLFLQKVLFKYLKNYFKGEFRDFEKIKEEQKIRENEIERIDLEKIKELNDVQLSKKLIYIPILNFIFLFQKENKYSFHIRNALTLDLILIILVILIFFSIISAKWLLILLFPICFGLGKLSETYYKMPYIYEIYRFIHYIKNLFHKSKSELKKRKNEVIEVNLKVE